jgi:predicted amidophosphoribosyltransferase
MIPTMLQQAMAGGAQAKIRCPNCKVDIPFGSAFCPQCGTNLSQTQACPQCKATLPAGSKFCLNCGAVQGAPAEDKKAEAPAAEGAESKDEKK